MPTEDRERRDKASVWLEEVGLSGDADRVRDRDDTESARQAKQNAYAAWDVHRTTPRDETQDDARAATWEAASGVVTIGDDSAVGEAARAAAWYVASDAAWAEAALPSGSVTRDQFRDHELARASARVRNAGRNAVNSVLDRVRDR